MPKLKDPRIKNYFEYFPSGPREEAWTVHLSAVGLAKIKPGDPYPPPKHPEDHYFTWERGRILSAPQLVAISKGCGMVEWRTEKRQVNAGDVMILQPGVWHRYRPDPQTGWTEQWVEFRGPTVQSWMQAGLFEGSILNLPKSHKFWRRFNDLHHLCSDRPMGFQAVAAGEAMTLLAEVIAGLQEAANQTEGFLPDLVRSARIRLLETDDIRDIAHQLGVSYPTLYRHFKQATGISPKNYASQIRNARAEDLLSGTELSIKEIAAHLGYHSASHFSLEFKTIHGISPSTWREREHQELATPPD